MYEFYNTGSSALINHFCDSKTYLVYYLCLFIIIDFFPSSLMYKTLQKQRCIHQSYFICFILILYGMSLLHVLHNCGVIEGAGSVPNLLGLFGALCNMWVKITYLCYLVCIAFCGSSLDSELDLCII